jgi:hypothetical protein
MYEFSLFFQSYKSFDDVFFHELASFTMNALGNSNSAALTLLRTKLLTKPQNAVCGSEYGEAELSL